METHFIFWVIIQRYFIYFIDSIFPVLAFGSCLSWLLCHFDPHQSGCFFFFFKLKHFSLGHCPSPACLSHLHLEPWRILIFYVTLVLPFPECDIIEIIYYVAFSRIVSFICNMNLSFLHVFVWHDRAFLFTLK